jgi:hypothetical protein
MQHTEFALLPDTTQSDLLESGMMFMKSITDAYGADTGMQLWDTIASTLDPEIKGQIFFRMLTGDGPNHLTLTNSNARSLNQFIPFIKCIRMATGLGLKEAKDIADLVEVGKSQKIKIIPTADKNAIKRELMTMRVSFL